MIPIKRFLLVLLINCCCITNLALAGDQKDISEIFDDITHKFQQGTVKYGTINSDNLDGIIPNLHRIRFSEGLEDVVVLWKKGYLEPVELAWWRGQFRSTRLLILCLYYGKYSDNDIGFFPRFEKNTYRFEENERKIRIEEIKFIKDNIPIIREKLGHIF